MNIILQVGWNKCIILNQWIVCVGEKLYLFNVFEVFCDDECFDYEVGVVEVSLIDVLKVVQRRLDICLGYIIYIMFFVRKLIYQYFVQYFIKRFGKVIKKS